MGDNTIRSVVNQIVGEVVGSHVKALCSEVVDKVSARLAGVAAQPVGADSTRLLNAAINSVQDHTSQSEILSALLEGCGKFSERTALFVLRSGNASGWRARGFANNEAIKSVFIDGSQGLVARAIHDRRTVSAASAEFDSGFLQAMGSPAEGANVVVLPLVVREKVAALVYADVGGTLDGRLDPSALEVLVRCSSLWIEVVAARKAGTPAELPAMPATQPAPMAAAAAAAAAAPATMPIMAPASEPEAVPAAPVAVAAPSPSLPDHGDLSPQDEDVHKKAKRFAKLLVDEIKLYNRKKVEQGRAAHNLYTLLKDDIEKSRATYDKRYGQSAAASADYFNHELVRVLADGDKALLGSGFSG